MENAFAWLKSIMEWFGQFVPRWDIVPTTHGWIKFKHDGTVEVGGAGFVCWWEVLTRCEKYPTARQTTPLPSQIVTTADEKAVAVSGLLVYEIVDLEKILAHTYDPEDTVKDIAASALHEVLAKQTWEQLRTAGRTLDTQLRREAAKDLTEYGVRIIKFTLLTLAKARVSRHILSTFQEGELRGT